MKNRRAWDPVALIARLKEAERQLHREEAPWICGLTLALTLSLAGMPGCAPMPPDPSPSVISSPSGSPSPTPQPPYGVARPPDASPPDASPPDSSGSPPSSAP